VIRAFAALSLLTLLAGCASTPHHGHHGEAHAVHSHAPSAAASAVAVLRATEGHAVTGAVTFTEVEGGVRVFGDFTGLTPGDHGFHVHEHGDCSAPDAMSAGGHFNPHGHDHGLPGSPERHAGDFGNVTAGEDGRAHYDRVFPGLAIDGEHGVLGRGLIVHADPDDGSQPLGDAGPRVACAVITRATEAIAEVRPTEGHQAAGTVVFVATPEGTRVVVRLSGVPEGPHGFHVHHYGDCSDPDAMSAGGHFNPKGVDHGIPGESHELHIGDMGNVVAAADDTVSVDLVFDHLPLDGPYSIIGRSVIVHVDPDDGGQPLGNAGPRIGCGVILPR